MNSNTPFKSLLFLLLSGSLLFAAGCQKDAPARDKFIGSYSVNENCTSGTYAYSISITTSANSEDDIIIEDFGNYTPSVNIVAKVSDTNISFNETKNGINFTGSGSISGNTLTIIYTASQSGATDNCTTTGIKQ